MLSCSMRPRWVQTSGTKPVASFTESPRQKPPPAGVEMSARTSSVSTAGQVVLVLQAEGFSFSLSYFFFLAVLGSGYGGSSGDLKLQAPVHWRGVSILQEKWWRASWASGKEQVQQLQHADEAYSNYRWTNQMFNLKIEHIICESLKMAHKSKSFYIFTQICSKLRVLYVTTPKQLR